MWWSIFLPRQIFHVCRLCYSHYCSSESCNAEVTDQHYCVCTSRQTRSERNTLIYQTPSYKEYLTYRHTPNKNKNTAIKNQAMKQSSEHSSHFFIFNLNVKNTPLQQKETCHTTKCFIVTNLSAFIIFLATFVADSAAI